MLDKLSKGPHGLPAGAIFADESHVSISGSTFVNNSAGFGGKRASNEVKECALWAF